MSKPDWKGLQSQFAAAHASTGIKLEDWCEQQGLNYNTARRYIKKPAHNSAQKKTAQKPAQKSQKTPPALEKLARKTAQKKRKARSGKIRLLRRIVRAGKPARYVLPRES